MSGYLRADLHHIIESQNALIAELKTEIDTLKQRISELEHKKHSGNSNLPPSTDIGKTQRTKSLRRKSDRKPGGQSGHEGSTLKMSPVPDKIETHIPVLCDGCGSSLVDVAPQLFDCRQVVDLPPVKPVYTEHRSYYKQCRCGCVTSGTFPDQVPDRIQYGKSIMAWVAYLNVRQYIPYNRIRETLFHLTGLSISEGSIYNMIQEFAGKSYAEYDAIKTQIESSTYVGTDETGAKVNGSKHWFWTWQNEKSTYIAVSPSRGFKTIETIFPNGLQNSILGHDRWAAHFQCTSKGHQICLAHLQRELNYLDDLYNHKWPVAFRKLLEDALRFRYQLNEQNNWSSCDTKRAKLERRLDELLKVKLPDKLKKARTLQKKLSKIRNYIFVFLYNKDVPPDNNGSERAIRNIKVKEKVSGQFRSFDGARAFAIIRSVIDSSIKKGRNCFETMRSIATLAAE